jgi:hypothetical protein
LADRARQERLEITYELHQHLFSVGLTVTIRGDSRALSRFASFTRALLFRYQPTVGD